MIEYLKLEQKWNEVNFDNKDELQKMLDEMESSHLENFWILHRLCWANYTLGNLTKAETIIKKQIEKYPDLVTSYTNMGYFYMDQQKFEKAVEYYEKALNVPIINDSKRLYCYEQLATAYDRLDNKAKVLDCNRKALKLYESYWIPEENLERVNKIRELIKNE